MEEMTEEQKAKRAEEEFKKSRRQKSSGRTVLHHSGCKKHFCYIIFPKLMMHACECRSSRGEEAQGRLQPPE
jgi:hypothetical protein